MTRIQLLGHVDADTREWYDGVLTSIAQQVYGEKSSEYLLIILLIIHINNSIIY